MRKLQAVLLALVTMFALSAVTASSAFAELAEWLANGAEIKESLATRTTGELLLENNETPILGKSSYLCNFIIIGTVGANGADTVTEILNLKEEKIGELGGLPLLGQGKEVPTEDVQDCVAETGCAEGSLSSPIEVWPVGLPWTSVLTKSGGKWTDATSSAKEVGLELFCLVLGINTEDKCTYAAGESASVEVVNDANGNAEIPAGAIVTPLAKCTASGNKASGVYQFDELANILLVNGELLSVS